MAKQIYRNREPVDAILDRLSEPTKSGCWKWNGKHGTHGYAYIAYRIGPKNRVWRKTATVAWELANAMEVPRGLEISHLCSKEWCVNPEHLTAETHRENLRRREWSPLGQRYKVNCKHCGGPKEQVPSGVRTEWVCRPCRAERARRWRSQNTSS